MVYFSVCVCKNDEKIETTILVVKKKKKQNWKQQQQNPKNWSLVFLPGIILGNGGKAVKFQSCGALFLGRNIQFMNKQLKYMLCSFIITVRQKKKGRINNITL